MKVSSSYKIFLLTACVAALAGVPRVVSAQDYLEQKEFEQGSERTTQLLVMLAIDYEGTTTFGAGILFGRQNGRLLIATAYHLIHKNLQKPNSIHVTMKTMPDKILDATILNHLTEREMDLAVISVEDPLKKGKCELPFHQLGYYRRSRGSDVYPVGNPDGVAWGAPVEPDKIARVSGNEIVFQSVFISIGHSGGGLLDGDGHLIGMITADQPPYGRAIDMDSVLARLEKWGYPIDLETAVKPQTTTPLHIAAAKGDIPAITDLLANCAEPDAQDESYETPLIIAAGAGNTAAITLLLKAGAHIEAPGFQRGKPLHAAIRGAHINAVKALLQAGAKPNGNKSYAVQLWPLGLAITAKNIAILELLVTAGADINARSESGDTPLSYAAGLSDNKTIVDWLRAHGAKQ